jgi:hypothetical protein
MEFEDNFKGIPIADLMSAPLIASCEAQTRICREVVTFVKSLIKEDGSPQTLDFVISQILPNNSGELQKISSRVKAPILGLVPVPGLLIQDIEIEFTMEVHSTSSISNDRDNKLDSNKKNNKNSSNSGLDEWLKDDNVQMTGVLSSNNKSNRSTDNSAKYNIKILAKQYQMPEGMARVLDMMAHSIGTITDK